MTGQYEARQRLRAYSRRWLHDKRFGQRAGQLPPLVGELRAWDWLGAYLRRSRLLDRRAIVAAALVQWVPREGRA